MTGRAAILSYLEQKHVGEKLLIFLGLSGLGPWDARGVETRCARPAVFIPKVS